MSSPRLARAIYGTTFYGIRTVQVLCTYYVFGRYVGDIRVCEGASMFPTLGIDLEFIFVSRLSYHLRPPGLARGDLVAAYSPAERTKVICKRVIGLPGDTVCTDPTGIERPAGEHVVVPKGQVWLAGDNVRHSTDSRTYGPIPLALVQGKVVARIWPAPCILRNPLTYID